MSQQPNTPASESVWKNPQTIVAIITGIVTVLVALIGILPNILPRNEPEPTPVVVVVAATAAPPTSTSGAAAPTHTSLPAQPSTDMPATAPTDVPAATAPPANVLLLYDEVSFTLLNQSGRALSLQGVIFRSSAGQWDALRWGDTIYDRLPNASCLRIRDNASGTRQPPRQCADPIYGLMLVQGSDLFWLGVSSFDVLQNGAPLATCQTAAETCALFIP
ncbi:MAG: hypothetical protein HXY40_04470 [Chloroflexi bacterium]|nr:hypothetical protein [Chloroflexota bacterium]